MDFIIGIRQVLTIEMNNKTCQLTYFIFLLMFLSRTVCAQDTDTIYSSDYVKIVGDTSVDETKIHHISIKFEPYISFKDFKARSVFKGVKAPIDFKSNITARRFRTRITETYQSAGLNFAGHFCFVSWGCGSPCQSSAVVDLITGKVYDGPPAAQGYDFRKDSNMLIVNPPDPSGFYDDCSYCHPEIWIWDDQSKKFRQKKPGS